MSINVAGYNNIDKENKDYKEQVYPLRTSNYFNREHEVDLLLISNDDNQHYCIIKNFSRLIYGQQHKKEQRRYYCRKCYASYTSQEKFETHKELCGNHETVKIEMPTKKPFQCFANYYKSQKVPFVIYADFECLRNLFTRVNQFLKVHTLWDIKNMNLLDFVTM